MPLISLYIHLHSMSTSPPLPISSGLFMSIFATPFVFCQTIPQTLFMQK